ncbi:MAG: alanine--tRNA ligase, partial [Blastocatellia bacterium]|nr:alanine--tRNA ligase [Blastocatellia bacterium]
PEGMSMRVVADHARATAFSIADGILPGNAGRGYVLRKIMRRAIYHGSRRLEMSDLFFHKVTDFVTHMMGGAYPELLTAKSFTEKIVQGEERRFRNTLNTCLPRFNELLERTGGQLPEYRELARLYDTYGMPFDLMKVMLEHQGHEWNQDDFDHALTEIQQPETQTTTVTPKVREIYQKVAQGLAKTVFTGYEGTELLGSKVLALLKNEQEVPVLLEGEEGELVLDRTPFYAESGGQVGDTGTVEKEGIVVRVADTFSPVSGLYIHKVKVEQGSINVGDEVAALVAAERRRRIMLNHTATHLMHAALKEVLGPHIKQAGSLVAPDRLRFDFTHYAALTDEEINEIERLVNDQIQRNPEVTKQEMALEEALSTGAVALFGEKYSAQVRVVAVPGFSLELCGGTHVAATGDIGLFKIISDSSISAGIRRIEAITGPVAFERYQQATELLDQISLSFKTGWQDIPSQIEKLQASLKTANSQVEALKLKLASQAVASSLTQSREVAGVKIFSQQVEELDRGGMRQLADNLSQQLGSSVVVLGMKEDGKAALIVRVSNDLTKKLSAGKIVKELAAIVGGGGGGRPDMAEAGGRDATKLTDALDATYETVASMLQ